MGKTLVVIDTHRAYGNMQPNLSQIHASMVIGLSKLTLINYGCQLVIDAHQLEDPN